MMKTSSSFRPRWRVLTSHVLPWTIPDDVLEGFQAAPEKLTNYIIVITMVAFFTLGLWQVRNVFEIVNIALVYLLPVLISAVRYGIWPSFVAAGLSVLAFDYFFVPPVFSYTVGDLRYLISFAVFLAVATLTAGLATKLRLKAMEARRREAITSALYGLSRKMANVTTLQATLNEVVEHVSTTLNLPAAIALPDTDNMLKIKAHYFGETAPVDLPIEHKILTWVYQHGELAGYGSHVRKRNSLIYVPLKTETNVYGVMCVGTASQTRNVLRIDQLKVIESLAGLAAVSIARIQFEEAAKVAHLTAESERIRTALLDSISHELRTPLATIIGAVTGMMETGNALSSQDQQELFLTIQEGAMRMNRLVTNLLGMVRIESGLLHLNKQSHDVEDMLGVALRQIQNALDSRTVDIYIENKLPTVLVDDVLIEQVLVNVISNAVKYSPNHSKIFIRATALDNAVQITITDAGIGLNPEETYNIFDKFFRSNRTSHIPGTGLGLAICKSIMDAHNGQIYAKPNQGLGSTFTINLPRERGNSESCEEER